MLAVLPIMNSSSPPSEPKRPRRPRSRWSAAARLPKMNNSERGKFYRKKYKDYEQQLARDVLALRARVRELSLVAELRRQLRDGLCVADAGAAAAAALDRLDALKSADAADVADRADAPPVPTIGVHLHNGDGLGDDYLRRRVGPATTTRFELEALRAVGAADTPVILMVGRVSVLRLDADQSADDELEQEIASYPCTYRLLFSADCASHELLADVGVAHQPLWTGSGSNSGVGSSSSSSSGQDVCRVTASLASASLEPRRLPGVRQLLRVAEQHADGYSSAGTPGTDSSQGSLVRHGRRRSVEAPARLPSAPPQLKPPTSQGEEDARAWPQLRLGKRPRAMTMDFILS